MPTIQRHSLWDRPGSPGASPTASLSLEMGSFHRDTPKVFSAPAHSATATKGFATTPFANVRAVPVIIRVLGNTKAKPNGPGGLVKSSMVLRTEASSLPELCRWLMRTIDRHGKYVICADHIERGEYTEINSVAFAAHASRVASEASEAQLELNLLLVRQIHPYHKRTTIAEMINEDILLAGGGLACVEWCRKHLPDPPDPDADLDCDLSSNASRSTAVGEGAIIGDEVVDEERAPLALPLELARFDEGFGQGDGAPPAAAGDHSVLSSAVSSRSQGSRGSRGGLSVAEPLIYDRTMTFTTEDWSAYRVRGRELIRALQFGDLERATRHTSQQVDVGVADPDTGENALMLAAGLGATHICCTLLEQHADVGAQSFGGATALILAAHPAHREVCELLMRAKPIRGDYLKYLETVDTDGRTALMNLAAHDVHLVRKLCSLRVDVNRQDTEQCSALHRATLAGLGDVVEVLCHFRADVNVKYRGQRTAVQIATSVGRPDIVQKLLARGAT